MYQLSVKRKGTPLVASQQGLQPTSWRDIAETGVASFFASREKD